MAENFDHLGRLLRDGGFTFYRSTATSIETEKLVVRLPTQNHRDPELGRELRVSLRLRRRGALFSAESPCLFAIPRTSINAPLLKGHGISFG